MPAPSEGPPTTIVEADLRASELATPEIGSVMPLHAGRVLLSTDGRPHWGMGPALYSDSSRYHEKWQIERAADPTALPPELRKFAGATLDLYGPGGRVCTVKIDALTVEAHLSMQYIDGQYELLDDTALWQALSNEADYEVAILVVGSFAADPRCATAVWARDASLPAPEVLVLAPVEDHAALLADEQRRALESDAGIEFTRAYQSYVVNPEYAEDAEPWSSVSAGRRQVWVDSAGAARFVAFSFGEYRFAPCHWLGPVHGHVRQIDEDRDTEADTSPNPLPVAVFDANGDGDYEFLFIEDSGEFDLVHVISATRSLRMEFTLPDNSHVWC
ncbi:hypothetical protein DB30_05119 [Enhygromyxa salina]|uniref:Uncharacterized protein n=1 Tax=Enhygromyxa salina TaxID=215803 RepID=A0A0C1ZXM4_9BACT|nr:hypothetical protein DB30_05119 [Enhygromyxa salina]